MWFRFPDGTTSISVQQQAFGVEAENTSGAYFRAPDHFAGIILDLPGFTAVSEPPEGTDLGDLPKDDPLRDAAIGQLTAQVDRLKMENEGLKAAFAEVSAERDDWKLKALDRETQIKNLESDLEEERKKNPDEGKSGGGKK